MNMNVQPPTCIITHDCSSTLVPQGFLPIFMLTYREKEFRTEKIGVTPWENPWTQITWYNGVIIHMFSLLLISTLFFKAIIERVFWRCNMQWIEPSCALTTGLLLPLCCDRSEWSCHGFHTLPLYMTCSSWPFRTNCPCYWCSASRTPPST